MAHHFRRLQQEPLFYPLCCKYIKGDEEWEGRFPNFPNVRVYNKSVEEVVKEATRLLPVVAQVFLLAKKDLPEPSDYADEDFVIQISLCWDAVVQTHADGVRYQEREELRRRRSANIVVS